MDGIVRNVYEIFEIIMAVTVLILISSAILFVSNPNNLQASARASEISYISTLISNSNIVSELNYEDTIIESNDENVRVTYKDKDNVVTKNYIGGEVKTVEIKSKEKYKLCSGETCKYLTASANTP